MYISVTHVNVSEPLAVRVGGHSEGQLATVLPYHWSMAG